MESLHDLPGFSPASLRLLAAAGVEDVPTLANSQPAELLERLFKVYRADRDGVGSEPTAADVRRWISDARAHLAATQQAPLPPQDPLDLVPEAIVLPPEPTNIRSREAPPRFTTQPVPVRSQPRSFSREFKAELNRVSTVRLPKEKLGRKEPLPAESLMAAKKLAIKPPITPSNDVARFQPPTPRVENPPPVEREQFRKTAELEPAAEAEEEGQEEATEEFVSKAVKLTSGEMLPRRVVRGVPHPRPWRVWFGALAVLFFRFALISLVLGSLVLLPMAFLSPESEEGQRYMFILLGILLAWMVSGLLYLLIALPSRCRVCTNQLYVNKRCTKNAKAHSLWGFGLTGSLALHALLFGWFRCMYCGTAIRLRGANEKLRSRRGYRRH